MASLNPIILMRFMARIGTTYLVLWGLLVIGFGLIVQLYRSGVGLYVAIFVSLYSLVLVFHWLGRIIYTKRNELDYSPDQSPEREAERAAEELLAKRKNRLARIFKERRREHVLAILLSHIDEEEDRLAAHAWYHSELKQWDSKRLTLKHAPYYIRELRAAGKHIIADLIQQECRIIDPEFTIE